MLCDECQKRPACVHITTIHNNQKAERHLCEQCARKTGEASFSLPFENKVSVQDFLKGMFSYGYPDGHKTENSCPNCNMTYSDFNRGGKIGCHNCYITFANRVEPLIRRIHGSSVHTGKAPRRTGARIEMKQRLKRLRSELERLIAREEYEQAARIRDEIREVEKQLGDER